MKKNNTLLIVAALGAAAFYAYKKGMFEKKAEVTTDTPGEADKPEAEIKDKEKVDATIDTVKQGLTIPQAIEKAKEIASTLEDSKILIKTKEGIKNIIVRHGAKKKARQMNKKPRKKRGKKSKTSEVYNTIPYANAADYVGPKMF